MIITDPIPHTEAANFLRDKPAVAREIFDELVPELKARAFVITGVDAADTIQAVRDRIADIPEGEDWDKAKKDIVSTLDPWLGKGAERRAELLLRYHAYQSYAVANVRNLDANQDIFPYRQYMSAQDERVRASHQALNGIVLPADSPFWDRHTPPWEWGCRCDVRGITADEAGNIENQDKKKPIEKQRVLPDAARQKLEKENQLIRGANEVYDVRTGTDKGKSGPDWSVKDLHIPMDAIRKRYDPVVWAKFVSWADATQIDGMDITVGDWMRGEKGEKVVVKKVAGKRTLESLTKTMQEFVEGRSLIDEKFVLTFDQEEERREEARKLVEIPEAQRGKLTYTSEIKDKKRKKALKGGVGIIERFVAKSRLPNEFTAKPDDRVKARSFASKSDSSINLDNEDFGAKAASVAAHEIGHIIEFHHTVVDKSATAFFKKRTKGEKQKTLREITGRKEYGLREMAFEDKWLEKGGSAYMGKYYSDNSTELISMGIERLNKNPEEFFINDPEYFKWLITTLQNVK